MQPEVSLKISVVGSEKASSDIGKVESATKQLGQTVGKSFDPAAMDRMTAGSARATAGIEALNQRVAAMGHLTAGLMIAPQFIASIQAGGRALFVASAEAERLRTQLSFSVGNAAKEFVYLTQLSSRLGLEFASTAQAYAGFAAAARGTALEGQATREVFEAVSKASAVMGLSTDQSSGALLAIQQMMAKGVVSAEEFRGQLGERMPIALQAGAKALGVTTAEFTHLMESGKVVSEDFLPKFAKAITEMLGDAPEQAAGRLDASVARALNSWGQLKQAGGDSGFSKALASDMNALTATATTMAETMTQAGQQGAGSFEQLADATGVLLGRSVLGGLGVVAETVNGSLNLLSGGALDLSTSISLLPDNLRPAVEQLASVESKLKGAQAEYAALAKRVEQAPDNIYIRSELGQLGEYIARLKQARGELALLTAQPRADNYGNEGRGAGQQKAADDAALAAARQRGQAYAELHEKYATSSEKMAKAVREAKNNLGELFTPEIEKRIVDSFSKSATAGKSQVAAYESLIQSIREKAAAEQAALGVTDKLSAGEKTALKIMTDLRDGTLKLGESQKQALAVELERYLVAEKSNQAEADAAKAAIERAAALDRQVANEAQRVESLTKGNAALADEIAQLGSSGQALASYRAEKAAATAAGEQAAAVALDNAAALLEEAGALPEVAAGYRALAEARRATGEQTARQAVLGAEKAAKADAVKAAEESSKAWEKFADDIGRSLTDSLYRAFESGEDFGKAFAKSLQNTFKAMVLKFAVQATVSSAGSALGSLTGSGSGGAADAGSLLSAGSSLYSAATGGGIAGMVSGFGAGAASAASELALGAAFVGPSASLASGAVGAGASAGLATGSSAASGAMGAIASAAPYLAAVAGIISLIGTKKIFGGERVYNDSHLVGTVNSSGFSGNTGQDWQKDGGWFGKNRSGTEWTAATAELDGYFDGLYSTLRTQMIALGKSLGDDSVASTLDGFALSVNALSTSGDMTAMAQQVAEQMARGLVGQVAPYVSEAMTASGSTDWSASLGVLVGQTSAVGSALTLLGSSLAEAFPGARINDLLRVSDQIVGVFGGIDQLTSSVGNYYQAFYAVEEQQATALASMTDSVTALGLAMPETKDQFRALVDSLDLTTEGGRAAFATLMQIAPSFAAVADAATAATARLLATRQGWQDKLDVLTGATTERQLALQADLASTTDAATQALIRQVYAQEDMQSAAEVAAQQAAAAAEAAAQQAAAVASERAGLENQLLQAQGNTAALRAREIEALDASNRALQEQIYSLQDAAAVAQQRAGLESQLLQLQGNTAELRRRELAALDPSNRALQHQIYSLTDAAQAAREQAAAQEAAAAAVRQHTAAVAAERYALETQLLQAQGNTAALRERELAALDPSNRALQKQIWALEDSAAAANKAAAAADNLKSAWSALTDSLFDEVRRIRGLIGEDSSVGYAQAQSNFAIATAQARSGNQAAAESLPGLSQTLLTLAEANAATLVELQRVRAVTAGSLQTTGTSISRSRGLVVPQFAVGTNYVPQDMLAQIHEGEAIIPKAYNPAAATNRSDEINKALLDEIKRLNERMARIEDHTEKTRNSSERTARVLDDASRGKNPLTTEVAA